MTTHDVIVNYTNEDGHYLATAKNSVFIPRVDETVTLNEEYIGKVLSINHVLSGNLILIKLKLEKQN